MTEQDDGHGLKREVIEARNQAIKTDNQVKNLCMDVRSFEKRFDALERRTRLASVAVNLIVALVLAGCAYFVTTVLARSYEVEIRDLKAKGEREAVAAQKTIDGLKATLDKRQAAADKKEAAQKTALAIVNLLDSKKETAAGALLDDLDPSGLGALELNLCKDRFADLSRRQAAASYRAGRQALTTRDTEAAITAFRRSLRLSADGPQAKASREYLAWALWQTKRFSEAEPLLREWLNAEPDEPTGTARYLLATSLVRQNRIDAARAEFLQVAGRGERSRFAKPAQAYLDALAAGGELPVDLPDGRVRPSVAPAKAPAAPNASADDAP